MLSKLRAVCGVQLKGRRRAVDLVLTLGTNEAKDLLDIASSVYWLGNVFRKGDGRVM